MKQASLIAARRSQIEDVPLPPIGESCVLVRVLMSGVCASELHTWEHGAGQRLALGHEVAGEIVAIGSSVTEFRPGDWVTGLFDAGFSDYAAASVDRVMRLPDNVAIEDAFGEPLACAVSAARRTHVDLGDRIAIVGLGFMGQLMLRLLALKGASQIVGIDLRADARGLALSAGCDRVLDSAEAAAAEFPPFDLVVEATGTPEGLHWVGRLVREHGRLSILGYHQGGPRAVDMQMWNYKALDVLNAHERRVDYRMDCMRRAFDLMSHGKLDLAGLATHRFTLDRVDDAFAALAGKPDGFVKAVVMGDAKRSFSPEIPVF